MVSGKRGRPQRKIKTDQSTKGGAKYTQIECLVDQGGMEWRNIGRGRKGGKEVIWGHHPTSPGGMVSNESLRKKKKRREKREIDRKGRDKNKLGLYPDNTK